MDFQPMSPDEIQRTIQSLLHQQAQFAADSAASQVRFDARIEKISAKTDQVAEGLLGLTAIVGHVVDSVSQIADAQKRTDEQLRDTDARLNVVIQIFERHLREDHGLRSS